MARTITLKDFNLGGQADSDRQGEANSLARIVGMDIHSDPGLMKVSQALTKESGATVTEFCKNVVECSDGNSYWFSADSGKIWKRTSAGSWSLIHTNSEGACLGAFEQNGFIYYGTENYLGRWLVGLAWSVAVDDWKEFDDAAKDPAFKPMLEKNLVLYIGDSNFISQVDESEASGTGTIAGATTTLTGTGTAFDTEVNLWDRIKFIDSDGRVYKRTVVAINSATDITLDAAFDPDPSGASFTIISDVFSGQALDLPKGSRIKSLGSHLDELLIGTFVSDNVNRTKIFRWDTWSRTFNSDDEIPETGINAFIPEDNIAMVSGGQKGNLYYYDGRFLKPFKRIRGDWSGTNKATVHPDAVANHNGLPLFGLSNVLGDPTLQGVYSLGAYSANYPKVLSMPYVISEDVVAGIEIGAIAILGDDVLVSWKNQSSYGVDKIDWSNKYNGAYFETRIIEQDRGQHKTFSVEIGYKTFPSGTTITIKKKVNDGAWVTMAAVNDAKRRTVKTTVDAPEVSTIAFRVFPSATGNNAPEIDSVVITME